LRRHGRCRPNWSGHETCGVLLAQTPLRSGNWR
jgi:hypothetical protein